MKARSIIYSLFGTLVLLLPIGCTTDDAPVNEDMDAPIISINLNDGDTDVARDITIVISSSEALHHANGVAITDDALQSLILFEDEDAESVPYQTSIDASGQQIMIDPDELLNPAEEYSLSFEVVHDAQGNATQALTISFTIESFDFTAILSKWSVTEETFSSFDASGTLIEGPTTETYDDNFFSVEFEGSFSAGTFQLVQVDEVSWITGMYETNPSDTSITVDVNNGKGDIPEKIDIEVISITDQNAEFFVTLEILEGTDLIRQEISLTLKKNDSSVPVTDLEELKGEWSVTSFFEEKFVESNNDPGEFIFFSDYTLASIPHDRFTFTFEDDEFLWFIDTYYTDTWEVGEFDVFDGSNFFYARDNPEEKFLHLSSKSSNDGMGLIVFSYDVDEHGNNLMLRTEYELERNDGTGLVVTLDNLLGSWLATGFVEKENGVDVTDPNDEDTPLGSTTTFNSDLTATSVEGTRVTNLTYQLIDGNSLAIVIDDEDVQDQLFHIESFEVDGSTTEMRLAAAFVAEEDDCIANCELILFEFELLLEKQ